jgi:hypothetical protein
MYRDVCYGFGAQFMPTVRKLLSKIGVSVRRATADFARFDREDDARPVHRQQLDRPFEPAEVNLALDKLAGLWNCPLDEVDKQIRANLQVVGRAAGPVAGERTWDASPGENDLYIP